MPSLFLCSPVIHECLRKKTQIKKNHFTLGSFFTMPQTAILRYIYYNEYKGIFHFGILSVFQRQISSLILRLSYHNTDPLYWSF